MGAILPPEEARVGSKGQKPLDITMIRGKKILKVSLGAGVGFKENREMLI